MDSIRSERPFFVVILTGPERGALRREILKRISKRQVQAVAEIAANVLFGTIGLSHRKRSLLRTIKPFLRSLADQKSGPTLRKRIILSHPNETFLLVQTVFKNLDELIWRAG